MIAGVLILVGAILVLAGAGMMLFKRRTRITDLVIAGGFVLMAIGVAVIHAPKLAFLLREVASNYPL